MKEQKGLIIRPASLPENVKAMIQLPTPQEFILKRPGKGKREFTYVEGGYVIARLNQVFSPVGWDFEVTEHIIEPKEVVVKGKLTIKDHKNGYSISKTQFGTKERHAEVPLGDTLKAAATDCLKKCASLFGIALDVYWKQLDENKPAKEVEIVSNEDEGSTLEEIHQKIFIASMKKISGEKDPTILAEFRNKIETLKNVYSDKNKTQLLRAIDTKLNNGNN